MKNFFVDADISNAYTILTAVYRSADFFDMTKEKIFDGSWQGRYSLTREKGTHHFINC